MMKKYGLITKVLLISMFAILLNGCENSLTSEFSSKANEAKFYTITGNIDVDAISAENSSRTGLPTIPSINDNSINFSVSAKMGDETITGTVTGNQYSITLPKGSWTITVIGKKAEVKVLEGSINVNPEDEPTTQQTITLKTINAGTGSLSLTITNDSELSCGGVKATLYKTSTDITENYLTFTTTNNSTKWDVKDLPAGIYEIKLDFYQEMTLNADGEYSCKNLLYSHHDTVNIFANLVTNTWTGSGYSEDKTTFTLTKAMITSFAMTTFYVSNSGDDSKAGTYFAPFKTLQAAVNKVTEMNNVSPSNENAPYRILLLSDIEDTSTGEDIDTNDGSLISIKNYSNPGLYLKIASYQNDSCFEIKGAFGRRIMNIEEGANVTIENITLTGGNINDNNGGGVYVAYNAIFTMGNGATISNCTGYNGGGVYVQSGTFNMNGGTISDCIAEQGGGVYVLGGTFTMTGGIIGKEIKEETEGTKQSWQYAATGDEGKHSNYAGAGGGGIYVEDGNVTINGGKISYNYVPNLASDCGGNAPSNTACGGGISVVKGNLTINNAEVSYNSGYQGGGIRCYNDNTSNDCTLTLNGTLIKGNTSNPYKGSSFGGGLMVKNFNVTFDGTTKSTIEQNYSGDGGALFLENTTSTLKNITIQNNSYNSNGYHYGSEVLLWANANVSIGSSSVVIKSDEPKGIFIYNDTNNTNNTNNTNTLNLSGDAKLDAPVYLTKGAMVTVTGNLTSESTVATITPEKYEEDTPVITAADSSINLAEQVGKFAVTQEVNNSGKNWNINAGGELEVTYSSWKALANAIDIINKTSSNSETELVISGDLTATETITISKYVKITSKGKVTISRDSSFANTFFTINAGSLELSGITLDGGNSARDPLLWIFREGNSLTLTNCILQNNSLTNNDAGSGNGGAVKVESNFTMNNSSIQNCSANVNGGAVYIFNGGSFTMDGGSISNCSANDGGAVYVEYPAVFTMTGGTISGCTANQNGGAVYIGSGNLTLSGDAEITSDNDVYLANGNPVIVAGELTKQNVATITPNEYTVGTQVLAAGTDVTLSNDIVKKFAVTPQITTNWTINSEGKLQQL